LGQKCHPVGLRLGIIKSWNSKWYAPDRKFADLVHEDMMIKRYISKRLDNAGIARVHIARAPKRVTVDIHTARPGIVIGRKGAEVDKLREELQLLTTKDIMLNIVEVRKPELDARLVADSIARQLEGRVAFRRAMKKSLMATMKMGAVGIKIQCGGRLGGAEIARSEKYRQGRVPLHTLRADIDYATATAHTTYGTIGVKVWIMKGEILDRTKVFVGDDAQRDIEPGIEPSATQRRKRPGAERGRAGRPRGKVRRSARRRPREGEDPPVGRRPETKPASASAKPDSREGDKPATAGKPKAKARASSADTTPAAPKDKKDKDQSSGERK
jgi:small subunit ribosomal protein S3